MLKFNDVAYTRLIWMMKFGDGVYVGAASDVKPAFASTELSLYRFGKVCKTVMREVLGC